MTPKAQRIALAQACKIETETVFYHFFYGNINPDKTSYKIESKGWKTKELADNEIAKLKPLFETTKPRRYIQPANIPLYNTDLNALYDAESLLVSNNELSIPYLDWLTRLSCPWHASAPQRLEALLRTLNLWKD